MVVIEIDLQTVLGFSAGALAVYAIAKRKLHQVRLLIDAADDAATNDKVTEAEFQNIWKLVKKVAAKEE